MTLKTNLTQFETLENYRIALVNVENQTEIAATMVEFGYDVSLIAEGKDLLSDTVNAYNLNKTKDNETIVAYSIFSSKKKLLDSIYGLHRKKAKVVFRKDALICHKLAIAGVIPQSYIKKMEIIKKFYNGVSDDVDIRTKLERLKISAIEISDAQGLINEVEAARIDYHKEKGESQDATTIKDDAFAKMDDWMSEFYAVAKIALDDRSQLLEALGIVVKS